MVSGRVDLLPDLPMQDARGQMFDEGPTEAYLLTEVKQASSLFTIREVGCISVCLCVCV